MPFRRNRADTGTTPDPGGVDPGPPPGRPAPPSRLGPGPTTAVSRARINGLAGLGMLVLVVSGLGLPLPGGHLAADAVLVVAGFQLGLGVTRLSGTSPTWLRRFWLSAVGPVVVPTAVAVVLATAYWWWLDRLGPDEIGGALTALAMVANLTPPLTDAGFAATDHLWLIGLIVQFALLVPLVAVIGRRTDGHRSMLRLVITAVAAVAVARLTMAVTGLLEPTTLAQTTFTRLDGLLLGLGVAVAPRPLIKRIPPWATPLALVTLLAVFVLAPDPSIAPAISLGLLTPVVAVAAAVVVASSAPAGNDPATRLLGSLWPRWLGERAISIYIWHQLFGMALTDEAGADVFGADWPGPGLFVTRLVFALAAGAASYRYLQLPLRTGVGRLLGRPDRRSGRGLGRPADAPPPPALSPS